MRRRSSQRRTSAGLYTVTAPWPLIPSGPGEQMLVTPLGGGALLQLVGQEHDDDGDFHPDEGEQDPMSIVGEAGGVGLKSCPWFHRKMPGITKGGGRWLSLVSSW